MAMSTGLSIFSLGIPLSSTQVDVPAYDLSFKYFCYADRSFRVMSDEETELYSLPFASGRSVYRFGVINREPEPLPLVTVVGVDECDPDSAQSISATAEMSRIEGFLRHSTLRKLRECYPVSLNGMTGYAVAWTDRPVGSPEVRMWKLVSLLASGREYSVLFVAQAASFEDTYEYYCRPTLRTLAVKNAKRDGNVEVMGNQGKAPE
jgi:hypothetical protein